MAWSVGHQTGPCLIGDDARSHRWLFLGAFLVLLVLASLCTVLPAGKNQAYGADAGGTGSVFVGGVSVPTDGGSGTAAQVVLFVPLYGSDGRPLYAPRVRGAPLPCARPHRTAVPH